MPDDDANRLAFRLINEVNIIAQLSRTLLEARLPDGVTAPHFTVLNHLMRVKDGQTPLALARAFQVPKTSMTNTLAGLEKRGLVEIRPNPEDGRSKQVWLTPQGRAFREEAIARIGPDLEHLRGELPGTDWDTALGPLTRLREALDRNRP